MAQLLGRMLFSVARQNTLTALAARPLPLIQSRTKSWLSDEKLTDPMEHATGLEKWELQALLEGNDDPYDVQPRKRGDGTKDNPNLVTSTHDQRIVGCLCDPDQGYVSFLTLYRGSPRRCGCGHWFKLVDYIPPSKK